MIHFDYIQNTHLNEVKINDLVLASILLHKKLIKSWGEEVILGEVYYCFQTNPKIEKVIRKYSEGRILVEPASFFQELRYFLQMRTNVFN